MNDIDRWFEQTARRQDRAVSLYASLLTDKIFAYFRYRLRLTLALATVRFIVRVAEFLIVLSRFGENAAFTVMILRIGSFIVNGAWWGLLEVMRERLREFSQSGKRDAIEREIGRWLVLAIITALILLTIGCVALARLLPDDYDSLGRCYAYLVIIELVLALPVRVLHSGMFATRRIYRPIWSIFTPIIIQLAVISVGIVIYPAAAIITAIVVSNAIGIWITVHYTLQSYRLTGLRPNHRTQTFSVRRLLPSIPTRLAIQTILGGLALRLDGMIIFAIFGIDETTMQAADRPASFSSWHDVDVFRFFYLILPLLRGASQSVGVFYFDFVRLRRNPALRQFRLLFFHKLLTITPIIALLFWLLAISLGLLVMPDMPASFLLALLPVFVMRTVISAYQIRMFAESRFRALNATVLLFAILLWLAWVDANPFSDVIQILAAVVTLLIVYINVQHLHDRATPPLPTLLSLGDWIRTLIDEPKPVRMGRITIPDWIPVRQKAEAVRLMQQAFNGEGHFAFRSPTNVLFYQRTTHAAGDQKPHLRLQTSTGGAANRGEYLPVPLANGRDALDRITTEKWIPSTGAASTMPDDPAALWSEFLRIFPTGIAVDLKTGAGVSDLSKLRQSTLAGILPTAMSSLEKGDAITSVSGRWLSAIFYQGELRLLFILPVEFEPEFLRNWLTVVKGWQVGHTPESASHACRR